MAQFSYFNKMVEKKEIFDYQNISKNLYDAMCLICRLPRVNILRCIVVASVVASLVVGTHI
jgi:hypothetical protein